MPSEYPGNVAVNAAHIGYLIGNSGEHFSARNSANLWESIGHAAADLAKLEERDSFDWGDQRNDWETVCDQIASAIIRDDRRLTETEILAMIQQPRPTPLG